MIKDSKVCRKYSFGDLNKTPGNIGDTISSSQCIVIKFKDGFTFHVCIAYSRQMTKKELFDQLKSKSEVCSSISENQNYNIKFDRLLEQLLKCITKQYIPNPHCEYKLVSEFISDIQSEIGFMADHSQSNKRACIKDTKTSIDEQLAFNSSSPVEFNMSRIMRHMNGKIVTATHHNEGIILTVANENGQSQFYSIHSTSHRIRPLGIQIDHCITHTLCIDCFLVICSENGEVMMYNLNKKYFIWKHHFRERIMDVASYNNNGKDYLYLALNTGEISVIENPILPSVQFNENISISKHPIQKLAITSCNDSNHFDYILVCAIYDTIVLVSLSTFKIVKSLNLRTKLSSSTSSCNGLFINQLLISGQLLWLTFKSSTFIQCWDLKRNRNLLNLDIHEFNQQPHSTLYQISAISLVENDDQIWLTTDNGDMLVCEVEYRVRQVTRIGCEEKVFEYNCLKSKYDRVESFVNSSDETPESKSINHPDLNTMSELLISKTITLTYIGKVHLSDSPIQFIIPLSVANSLNTSFVTISSYYQEENSIILWKDSRTGWVFKAIKWPIRSQMMNGFMKFMSNIFSSKVS